MTPLAALKPSLVASAIFPVLGVSPSYLSHHRQLSGLLRRGMRRTTLACCRFRGHRDWVFHEAGGLPCRGGSSVASSRLRRFGSFVTAVSVLPRRHGTSMCTRTCCANG